jgi:hypothetical protein
LVLLIDEVQYLYASQTSENFRISKHNVSLAKSSCVFVLMTGLTANLQELLFHKNPPMDMQRNHANFNHTVFRMLRLDPLRNAENVGKAVVAWKGEKKNFDKYFSHTGDWRIIASSVSRRDSGIVRL